MCNSWHNSNGIKKKLFVIVEFCAHFVHKTRSHGFPWKERDLASLFWAEINPDPELTGSVRWLHKVYALSFTTGTLKFYLMYYLLFCSHCIHLQAGNLA